MAAVNLPYVDIELDLAARGDQHFWRHFHWGYFDEPEREDDDPARYLAAAEALTEHLLTLAEVGDGASILDVGCGFGGTLDLIRDRNSGCSLHGLNIDHRQLQTGRMLLARSRSGGVDCRPSGNTRHQNQNTSIHFVTADACQLPYPDNTFDHLLAVECIFHFPSRKRFFREAARILKPGGTLALSDFLAASGGVQELARLTDESDLADWYGHSARPLTPEGYRRLARGTGFQPRHEEDITERTMPTYPAMRRMYREADHPDGVRDIDGLERLAASGAWRYYLFAYTLPRPTGEDARER